MTCPYCGERDKRPGRDSCAPCDQPIRPGNRGPRKAAILRDRERWPRRQRLVVQRRHQSTGEVETVVQWRSTIKARSAPFAGRTTY